jgi:hypothetical protein
LLNQLLVTRFGSWGMKCKSKVGHPPAGVGFVVSQVPSAQPATKYALFRANAPIFVQMYPISRESWKNVVCKSHRINTLLEEKRTKREWTPGGGGCLKGIRTGRIPDLRIPLPLDQARRSTRACHLSSPLSCSSLRRGSAIICKTGAYFDGEDACGLLAG